VQRKALVALGLKWIKKGPYVCSRWSRAAANHWNLCRLQEIIWIDNW
jgi:hypothetical protein